jgi:hypothetical protein
VTPTTWRALVGLFAVAVLLGYVLTSQAYAELALPVYAPVTAVLLTAFEVGLARVVLRSIRGLPVRRPLHALQVARAAALAKASSAGGSLLSGFYGGYLAWTAGQTDRLREAAGDAVVAAVSAAACLGLMAAGLWLERACRAPDVQD